MVGLKRLIVIATLLCTACVPAMAAASTLGGETSLGGNADSTMHGQAEAFQLTASKTGSATALDIYLDTSSGVIAGLYSSSSGHPATLLGSGSVSSNTAHSWTGVSISSVSVTAGASYWIAVLPHGSASKVQFKDVSSGSCGDETSSQENLTALTSTWSTGETYDNCPISAYMTGTVAPANTASPTISGTAKQGETLTASTGTWTGDPTITYAYQWQRSGTNISGATSSSYTLTSADAGHTIDVVVTASNAGGSVSATSASTATVSASCPMTNTGPAPVEGIIYDTSSHVTIACQTVKEIVLEPGVSGVTIAYDHIEGGYFGIFLDSDNCEAEGAPESCGEGGPKAAAITETTIVHNYLHGPFGEDAIHVCNWDGLDIEDNYLTDFEESGNHTDALQSVWGGSSLTFRKNVVTNWVGEGLILNDGAVKDVTWDDNLFAGSATNAHAPEGEAPLQVFDTADLEMSHNTYADNSAPGEVIRKGSSHVEATHNVFDNLEIEEVPESVFAKEEYNVVEGPPWSFFYSGTDTTSTPTFVDPGEGDYRTTMKMGDEVSPGIDFEAAEVEDDTGPEPTP